MKVIEILLFFILLVIYSITYVIEIFFFIPKMIITYICEVLSKTNDYLLEYIISLSLKI
jgi:hypothetical protein